MLFRNRTLINRAAEVSVKADAMAAASDVQRFLAQQGDYPDSISELNNGEGLTLTDGNTAYYAPEVDPEIGYCVQVKNDSGAVYYSNATGSVFEGRCAAENDTVLYVAGGNDHRIRRIELPVVNNP